MGISNPTSLVPVCHFAPQRQPFWTGFAVECLSVFHRGEEPPANDTTNYDNGVKIVPACLLQPILVNKENLCFVYTDQYSKGNEVVSELEFCQS